MSATDHTAHGEPLGRDDELTAVVRGLTDRIEALQADVRRLGGPGLPTADPGWSDEDALEGTTPSYAWIGAVAAPTRRRPGVPRLLLEVLFLAAVAAAAAVAKLDAPMIAGIMAASWLLVVLIELTAARAGRRSYEIPGYAPPAPAPEAVPADPSWLVPPIEQTLLEPAGESPTAIGARLPPPPEDPDVTVERLPGL